MYDGYYVFNLGYLKADQEVTLSFSFTKPIGCKAGIFFYELPNFTQGDYEKEIKVNLKTSDEILKLSSSKEFKQDKISDKEVNLEFEAKSVPESPLLLTFQTKNHD